MKLEEIKQKHLTSTGCNSIYCSGIQMKASLDELIVIPAVYVMRSSECILRLFDLHQWHITNTACHQSLFQSNRQQWTFDLSPLLAPSKVGAPDIGDWLLFWKKKKKGFQSVCGSVCVHEVVGCHISQRNQDAPVFTVGTREYSSVLVILILTPTS